MVPNKSTNFILLLFINNNQTKLNQLLYHIEFHMFNTTLLQFLFI